MEFEIAGGDGGAYGDNFGPLLAEDIGIVKDENGAEYLLLKLQKEAKLEGMSTQYITVSPRYVGDQVGKLRIEKTIVGISRVLFGKENEAKLKWDKSSNKYFAVGYCKPIH